MEMEKIALLRFVMVEIDRNCTNQHPDSRRAIYPGSWNNSTYRDKLKILDKNGLLKMSTERHCSIEDTHLDWIRIEQLEEESKKLDQVPPEKKLLTDCPQDCEGPIFAKEGAGNPDLMPSKCAGCNGMHYPTEDSGGYDTAKMVGLRALAYEAQSLMVELKVNRGRLWDVKTPRMEHIIKELGLGECLRIDAGRSGSGGITMIDWGKINFGWTGEKKDGQ